MAFNYLKQFGGTITPNEISRYTRSSNWNNKTFENLEETSLDLPFSALPDLLKKRFWDTEGREPRTPLPLPFRKSDILSGKSATTPGFVWFGHSVVLLFLDGKSFLIDPMFGPNASPIAPFPTRRFSENTLDIIDQLPDIDAVLLTHDHYDHLDYASIKRLKGRSLKYYTGLGTGRHLISWGIPEDRIIELDWWDRREIDGVKITYTPTRHFSGRGLRDRKKSMWGGWVLEGNHHRIYFSGDGGYGNHFRKIRERFHSFDFAFIECGQYSEYWRPVHLFPEESVQVGKEVNADIIMPVHWGGFALAMHPWKEPVREFISDVKKQGLKYMVPRLGEAVNVGSDFPIDEWWEEYE